MNSRAARITGTSLAASLSFLFFLASAPNDALADDDLSLNWGGRVQSDLRFRVEPVSVGEFYSRQELPAGVERNWNTLNLNLDASYGRFKGIADVDFVWSGVPERVETIGDLSRIDEASPYFIDARALYLEAKGVFLDELDLRVGQQVVSWGVGDQFNPTNNLNPDDLRDPLLFGKQASNFMVKADYWISEDWSLSGVLVPIFKPALLPASGSLAVAQIDRLPFNSPTFRHRVTAEQAAAQDLFGHPTVVGSVTPVMPDTSFSNMQASFRIAGALGEQDIALSYYNGRTDFPQPRSNHTHQQAGDRCNPDNAKDCIKGLLLTDVTLEYPRMHVYGLNVAGEVNPFKWISDKIKGIGYRIEGALVVPQRQTLKVTNDALALEIPQPAGEYDYDGDNKPGGPEPEVVSDTPFLKWVVGLDYTFSEHVYMNIMWVHGLADEYGAGDFIHEGYAVRQSAPIEGANILNCALSKDGERCAREILRPRLGDYAVMGVDFKLLNQAALFRIFAIVDATPLYEDTWDPATKARSKKLIPGGSADGFSMVIFPQLDYNFGNGLVLSAGSLLQLGKSYTKFGDAAAGGSLLWTRGTFSF